jgi:uncharacterized protein (TIGR02001 family)
MKMNKFTLACGVAMLGLSSMATAEITTNIGVTSNYVWRGMTQSANSTSFSGGLDWSSDMGIYAGTWIADAWDSYEMDLYGGYKGELGDFGYDGGLIYYSYTTDADSNFGEVYLNGSWKFLSAGLAYVITAEDAVEAVKSDRYYYVGGNYDLPQDFAIGLTVGYVDPAGDGKDDMDSFTHYQIDLSKSAGEFGDVTLSLSDTNMDDLKLEDGTKVVGEDSNIRFFVSWAKEF